MDVEETSLTVKDRPAPPPSTPGTTAMNNDRVILNAQSALRYLGQTALIEMVWDDDPETMWHYLHIVGVVLPAAGLRGGPHFLTLRPGTEEAFAEEAFWENIRTIRVMRYSDGRGSSNVQGR
ncbi:hypothetical protein LNN38_10060 [Pseudomonas sp. LA21]|uniref:hypothetical protein n=1 Tax=Pseudomonas sp. LA21 TaxID=2893373 RepID=UPI001FB7A637|nr:hypothetical protein [Pseudomonas sp. LA21]MCJ1885185.1 hypothetical protein [Pseudomonas sp. LA21]